MRDDDWSEDENCIAWKGFSKRIHIFVSLVYWCVCTENNVESNCVCVCNKEVSGGREAERNTMPSRTKIRETMQQESFTNIRQRTINLPQIEGSPRIWEQGEKQLLPEVGLGKMETHTHARTRTQSFRDSSKDKQ